MALAAEKALKWINLSITIIMGQTINFSETHRGHTSPDWPLSLTLRVQYHYHIKRRESLTITSQIFVRKFRYERNANAL